MRSSRQQAARELHGVGARPDKIAVCNLAASTGWSRQGDSCRRGDAAPRGLAVAGNALCG